jgi:shikimate dehydrogenase
LKSVYIPLEVKPEGLAHLVRALPFLNVDGANVTIPFKQEIIPFLDGLSPTAKKLGAVNTLIIEGGRIIGDNTDLDGFLRSWEEERGPALAGKMVTVLGAGGAARAVVAALASKGPAGISIFNRSVERGAEIAQWAGDLFPGISVRRFPLEEEAALAKEISVSCALVNTTSVGMAPHVESLPARLPPVLPLDFMVFDAVYNPPVTALMDQAIARGGRVAGGIGMLVHQAALSFERWTGKQAPVELMRFAALKLIAGE